MVDHGFGNPFHCVECAWFIIPNDNVVANAPIIGDMMRVIEVYY